MSGLFCLVTYEEVDGAAIVCLLYLVDWTVCCYKKKISESDKNFHKMKSMPFWEWSVSGPCQGAVVKELVQ